RAGQLRVHGCAVAALCAVAAGEMEAYLHVALNPWDFAAGQILVEEAGGVVSTWDGGRPKFFEGRASIAATNAPLHAETLSLLRGKEPPPSAARRSAWRTVRRGCIRSNAGQPMARSVPGIDIAPTDHRTARSGGGCRWWNGRGPWSTWLTAHASP